jgi:hypothetical protein
MASSVVIGEFQGTRQIVEGHVNLLSIKLGLHPKLK